MLILHAEGRSKASPIPYYETELAKSRRLRLYAGNKSLSAKYTRGFSVAVFHGIPKAKVSFVCYTTYNFLIIFKKFLNLEKQHKEDKLFLKLCIGYFLSIFRNKHFTRTTRQVACQIRRMGLLS
jgi:hypothetical protein